MVGLLDEAAQGHLVRDAIGEVHAIGDRVRSKIDATDIAVLRQCIQAFDCVAKPVADRIGKMGEPLVVRLDEGIGNVVLQVQEASKPRERVRPDTEPRPLTKERLLTEATENCFVRSRIQDVSALSATVYDHLEGSNGAVRLGLRTFEKATSWFTMPVLDNLTRISEPLISGIDSKIGGTVNSLQESLVLPARKLNENNELTVGSLVQVARNSACVRFDEALRRLQSSMSSCDSDAERENLISRMREAVQVGLIQYAEDIISRAKEMSLASNSLK